MPNFTGTQRMCRAEQSVDSRSRGSPGELTVFRPKSPGNRVLWKIQASFMNCTCGHRASSAAPTERICMEICPHAEDHQGRRRSKPGVLKTHPASKRFLGKLRKDRIQLRQERQKCYLPLLEGTCLEKVPQGEQ